jgi:hypothetical protein
MGRRVSYKLSIVSVILVRVKNRPKRKSKTNVSRDGQAQRFFKLPSLVTIRLTLLAVMSVLALATGTEIAYARRRTQLHGIITEVDSNSRVIKIVKDAPNQMGATIVTYDENTLVYLDGVKTDLSAIEGHLHVTVLKRSSMFFTEKALKINLASPSPPVIRPQIEVR